MGQDSALAAQSAKLSGTEAKLRAAEAKIDADLLVHIVQGTARVSGCDKLSFLEKPACYREFANKALKVGAGVGMFAYGVHYAHKDTVQHFGNLKKEAAGLKELRTQFTADPARIADPEYRQQFEKQVRAAASGARADIDKMVKDVLELIETVLVMIQFTMAMVALVLGLAAIVGDPKFKAAVEGVKENLEGIGKALDDINVALAKTNRALDDMNAAMDDINRSLGGLNDAIGKANKGMDQLNEGIGEANKGLDQMNKAVPGIKQAAERLREVPAFEFDFSHIGKDWSDGPSGLDDAEQQRRMSTLLGLIPGIGDAKGVIEAVTAKDALTGEHVGGFDRALGSLAVLRWLRLGSKLVPDDVLRARKGDVVFECNSFPAGTPVLMADGTRKPIQDLRAGDQVLATDPGAEFADLTRARPVLSVPFTPGTTERAFVRLTVTPEGSGAAAGTSVTSTESHRYWLPDRQDWIPAGELRTGDRLRTTDGGYAVVSATVRETGRQDTYDLDVSGIDSYYVGVGAENVLVHNCTNLARAGQMFPGLAHTLDEHVDVTRDRMKELAITKTKKMGKPTSNSRWSSAAVAQKAVDQLVDQNKARIAKWVADAGKGGSQQLPLTGTHGTGSLGDSMDHLGNYKATTSNRFNAVLVIKKGHKPGGFYVMTAYPV
ncbi:RNase A-like domain-containing protein [Streptomyces sp. NPDC054901]